MNTVIVQLEGGILKVKKIPEDTRVVLKDLDTGGKTTYKREGGGAIFKKRSRI